MQTPLGLALARATRTVNRAFDAALTEAGGSLPVWLVLVNLKADPTANQRAIAEAMGLSEATLTHHLNAMERDALITRRRDPSNRRVHLIEMTAAGQASFARLRSAAITFDRRLRRGVTDDEAAELRSVLDRLAYNVGGGPGGAPWAGLVTPGRD